MRHEDDDYDPHQGAGAGAGCVLAVILAALCWVGIAGVCLIIRKCFF